MNLRICISLSVVLVLSLPTYSAPNSSSKGLANYKTIYEKGMKKIENEHARSLETCLSKYSRSLSAIIEKLRKKGDLEAFMAARKERERLEKEKTVPDVSPADLPALMEKVQDAYRDSAVKAEEVRSRKATDLLKKYVAGLDSLKKSLMMQDNIEGAQKVNEEIKKAEFLLAVNEKPDQKAKPKPVAKTAQPKTSPEKPWVPAAARRGLALHYPFNKKEGDKVTDSSGRDNHGQLHGGKWSAMGKLGAACQFDGNDDYIDVGAFSSVDFASSDFSVAAWVKFNNLDPASYDFVFGNECYKQGIRYEGWFLAHYARSIQFQIRHSTGYKTAEYPVSKLRAGRWHHLVGTLTGSKVSLYVDGKLVSSINSGGQRPKYARSRPLRLGRSHTGGAGFFAFDGSMDEVMIWNRALSKNEVTQVFTASGGKRSLSGTRGLR